MIAYVTAVLRSRIRFSGQKCLYDMQNFSGWVFFVFDMYVFTKTAYLYAISQCSCKKNVSNI